MYFVILDLLFIYDIYVGFAVVSGVVMHLPFQATDGDQCWNVYMGSQTVYITWECIMYNCLDQ